MNQLGSSRAGQFTHQGTLNSVRTVQIPNAMNADKAGLLQGSDNMTNAYQHFLSKQNQQFDNMQGRKLQPRDKNEQ